MGLILFYLSIEVRGRVKKMAYSLCLYHKERGIDKKDAAFALFSLYQQGLKRVV
jgi:hypothetical protein